MLRRHVTGDVGKADRVENIAVFVFCEDPLYAYKWSEAILGHSAPNAYHSPSACCYSLNKLGPEPTIVTGTNEKKVVEGCIV
ncbi:hypothetical protein MTO96_030168 [Rhipicephalus appendiculatus]